MVSDDTEYDTHEASPAVFVVTVAPSSAAATDPQRAHDARLIGEAILDRWFGTDVATELAEGSALKEAVVVQQEVVQDEWAVLVLHDNKIHNPWELTDQLLWMSLDRLRFEVEMRRKRMVEQGEPG